jgi:hypothetical protein
MIQSIAARVLEGFACNVRIAGVESKPNGHQNPYPDEEVTLHTQENTSLLRLAPRYSPHGNADFFEVQA